MSEKKFDSNTKGARRIGLLQSTLVFLGEQIDEAGIVSLVEARVISHETALLLQTTVQAAHREMTKSWESSSEGSKTGVVPIERDQYTKIRSSLTGLAYAVKGVEETLPVTHDQPTRFDITPRTPAEVPLERTSKA